MHHAATGDAPAHRRSDTCPGLDGLRAISVLAVLAFHHYLIGGHEPGFAPGGFLGVEVFFVVSGYLITVAAARRAPRDRNASRSSASGCAAPAGSCPRCSCCSRSSSLYALLFLPDSIGTLKSDMIAALSTPATGG